MPRIHTYLNLDIDECMKYYSGRATVVLARSLDGRIIQFPATLMRTHVTATGIQGLFELEYDNMGKALEFRKIDK